MPKITQLVSDGSQESFPGGLAPGTTLRPSVNTDVRGHRLDPEIPCAIPMNPQNHPRDPVLSPAFHRRGL